MTTATALPTVAEILAEAKRLGVRLDDGLDWYDRQKACGCPGGIAAILQQPALAGRDVLSCHDVYGVLGADVAYGMADGFLDAGRLYDPGESPDYDAAFALGLAVRHAALPGLVADDGAALMAGKGAAT